MATHKATPGGPRQERQKNFASRLALMKVEAGELGLFATMQRMDVPLRMVGFEIAGDIKACEKHEAALLAAPAESERGGT